MRAISTCRSSCLLRVRLIRPAASSRLSSGVSVPEEIQKQPFADLLDRDVVAFPQHQHDQVLRIGQAESVQQRLVETRLNACAVEYTAKQSWLPSRSGRSAAGCFWPSRSSSSGHRLTFWGARRLHFNCIQLNCDGCNNLYCAQSNCVQYMRPSKPANPRETDMSVNVLYKTSAKATGGRDGTAATLDGALDVKLATPKELGGGGGAGNNPEQLFAAGYAACFIGAMKFVASQGGAEGARGRLRDLHGRHRPALGRRLWPRYRPRRLAARPSQGGSGSAGREGAPGVPVFQRHPRQCGCAPDGRLIVS